MRSISGTKMSFIQEGNHIINTIPRHIENCVKRALNLYACAHFMLFRIEAKEIKIMTVCVKPMLNALLRNMGVKYSTLFKYRQCEDQTFFLQQVL